MMWHRASGILAESPVRRCKHLPGMVMRHAYTRAHSADSVRTFALYRGSPVKFCMQLVEDETGLQDGAFATLCANGTREDRGGGLQ